MGETTSRPTSSSPSCTISTPPIVARSPASSPILAEELRTPDEPLALLLRPGPEAMPAAVCAGAARALLDLPSSPACAPPWLAPHQIPAFQRLLAVLARHRGAVLGDAVGLGKSYVALAVVQALRAPLTLVAPAVLIPQWTALMQRLGVTGTIVSHERLSHEPSEPSRGMSDHSRLFIVDEAHRFRNAATRRYRALARRVVGARVVLLSATPVHHHHADLLNLLRLFLRDDALVALGVPSLGRAARESEPEPALSAAVARLVVARSRHRVTTGWRGLQFPQRARATVHRLATAPDDILVDLVNGIARLHPPEGGGPLFRLMLLRRLASSLPALRQSLRRYEAYLAVAREAAHLRRRLGTREFRRLFPIADDAELQLAFLPLLLDAGEGTPGADGEADLVRSLITRADAARDPKAEALHRLLVDATDKTIVFAEAATTVSYLRRRLSTTLRVGAIAGATAWLGMDRASRPEVLRAFAPRAQGAAPPPNAARVEVLLATDLVGEGLNLQDAARVVHYDLPWSPARLAQRVGRVDRLASPHARVGSIAFLPPEPLASHIAAERRLLRKITAQISLGAAQVETIDGPLGGAAPLDWCDRLQGLAYSEGRNESPAGTTAVTAPVDACVLIVRLGQLVEAIVVERGVARTDAPRATALLEVAGSAMPRAIDEVAIDRAIRLASPLLRQRSALVAAARWRAVDREGAARRLIPWALALARRAARAGQVERLARFDALLARLSSGLTAGEGLRLEDLLARRPPLEPGDVLDWHERLPPVTPGADPPVPELVAGVLLVTEERPKCRRSTP